MSDIEPPERCERCGREGVAALRTLRRSVLCVVCADWIEENGRDMNQTEFSDYAP